MILLDTQVMVFDALEPARLTRRARQALQAGTESRTLACSDISLWEMAMLVARGRITVPRDAAGFIDDILVGRHILVLPITTAIAVLAQSDAIRHRDPADRMIAATAIERGIPLVTSDTELRRLKGLNAIW